jgi:DNA polymerase III sliding clamp (beta) subunit (PCNA family)
MIAKAMFDKEGSKRVISALKMVEKLDNTINLVVSEEGMKFVTLDRSHISFAILRLYPSQFEYLGKEEEMVFKPDCQALKKILTAYRNNKELIIRIDENNLIFEYFDDVNEIEFKSQFGTIDEHYDQVPKGPDIEWPAQYTVCFKDFKDVVCAASSISEKLFFKSSEETDHILTCFAEHSEKGEEKLSMNASFQTDTEYKDKVWACYATSRVQSLISSRTPFSDEVILGLGVDLPLSLIFRLENVGQLEFLTAPRIESEE